MSYVSRIYVGTITHVAEMENPVGMAGQSVKLMNREVKEAKSLPGSWMAHASQEFMSLLVGSMTKSK